MTGKSSEEPNKRRGARSSVEAVRSPRWRGVWRSSAAVFVTMTLVGVAPVLPAHASVGEPEASISAEELTARAVQQYNLKDYEGAVRLFEQAYALDANPNYLFNIGRVYEQSGQIEQAVAYYQRFVQAPGVDLDSRRLATERLQVLRAIVVETDASSVSEQPAQEPAPVESLVVAEEPVDAAPEGPQETEERPVEVTPPTRARPTKLEIAGYSVLGAGGVAVLLGAVFGGLALQQQNDLEGQSSYENRQVLISSGEANALAADILLISGGALVISGLVMALVGRSRRTNARGHERVAETSRLTFRPGRERALVYHF